LASVILAFDFGLKHIGVATGQTITRSASPLTTLVAKNGKPNWRQVAELVRQWRPDQLIVGLPLNMDDSESEMSRKARTFAHKLHQQTGVEVCLMDERLTSFAARQISADDNHALAASLIAESWLGQD
jgi:putative Holliday junction resolvase